MFGVGRRLEFVPDEVVVRVVWVEGRNPKSAGF